jgi:putative PIN family toxin of toxin-antitoxin system
MTTPPRIVLDTNVLVAALRSQGPANRLLLACLAGRFAPRIGQTLLMEYEDVMGRDAPFRGGGLSHAEREAVLDALLSVSGWVRVYFSWRPNVPDEGDNHLVELAVAAQAQYLVTHNTRHLKRMELRFPQLSILTPSQLLEKSL